MSEQKTGKSQALWQSAWLSSLLHPIEKRWRESLLQTGLGSLFNPKEKTLRSGEQNQPFKPRTSGKDKSLKIGFCGNINNYPLIYAETLKALGHQVIFIVTRGELLHRPEGRDPQKYGSGYPAWMIDGSEFSEWDYLSLNPRIASILEQLATCDVLFLNDYAPALQPFLGKPSITFITGSDLYDYADFQLIELRSGPWNEIYRATPEGQLSLLLLRDFVERQRLGVSQSIAVNMPYKKLIPAYEKIMSELGITDQQKINIQAFDAARLKFSPAPHNNPARIFCATRLTWKIPVEPGRSQLDYKGADIMIRGLALFYRKTRVQLDIRLVRKGWHVAETEQLACAEGLAEQITWLEEMPLAAIWEEFQQADLVFEQLGSGIVSMAALDALASGRPVIGNTRPEIPTLWSSPKSPVCQAQTPEEVCAQLERLVFAPAERERLGRAGRAFVEKHFHPQQAAEVCLATFRQALAQQEKGGSEAPAWAFILQKLAEHKQVQSDYFVRDRSLRRALHTLVTSPVTQLRLLAPPYQNQGGLCWTANLSELTLIADSAESLAHSTLMLFEDGEALGPSHSVHTDIQALGQGRFSHWLNSLYFSTSDGSDPNTNGRTYTIIYGAHTPTLLQATQTLLQTTHAKLETAQTELQTAQAQLQAVQPALTMAQERLAYLESTLLVRLGRKLKYLQNGRRKVS